MNRHSLADHEGARDNVRVSATATTVRKAPSHRYRHAVSPVRSCNYCNIGRTRRRMSSQQVPGVDHCTRCIPMLYRSPSRSRKPSRTVLCARCWPVLAGAGRCWPVLTGAVGEPGLLGTLLQGRCGSLDREALENLADCAQPEGWSRSRAVFSGQSDSFCLLHESRIWAIVRSDDRPATSNVVR